MAYKTSFILSLIFVIQLLLLIGDLLMVQFVQARLDAVGIATSRMISHRGAITDDVIDFVEGHAITFTCDSGCNPRFGDVVTFSLRKGIDPFILSEDEVVVKTTHYAVIGYTV